MIEWIVLAGIPLVPLTLTIVNLLTWRRGRVTQSSTRVQVLIPARNERGKVEPAIRSVLKNSQNVPNLSVVVCDDGSTDGMRGSIEREFGGDARVRVIEGQMLPSGWVGKPYVCHQLLHHSDGEVILFMDADVVLKNEGLGRLLSLLEEPAHGRVVSAVPEQSTGSFFERLILPLLTLTYTSWLPLRLVEKGRDARTVAANGQLMMIRKVDCVALGGFEAVQNEIVDDVAFCRHAKQRGFRVVFADGSQIASCRMYSSASEVIRGFSKNLYEGVGGSVGMVFTATLYFVSFVLPYVAFVLSVGPTAQFAHWLAPSVVGIGANVALRLSLLVRFRQPWEGVVLHPFAVVTLLGILANSFRWSLRNRTEWAGRSYASRSTRLKSQGSLSVEGGRFPLKNEVQPHE